MLHIVPISELHTVQVNSQCREHRIGHSGFVEPGDVLRQQPYQRRQLLRHRRWCRQRTATSLHTCLRLQRLQHLLQAVRHTLTRLLQRTLDGLAPLGQIILRTSTVGLYPVVRNYRHHLLQRIAADTADGYRQFESQHITVTIHRLLAVVVQFPILRDDVLKQHPIVPCLRVIGHLRTATLQRCNSERRVGVCSCSAERLQSRRRQRCNIYVLFLPRPIVLISLLGSWRHLFLSLSLTLLQAQILSGSLFVRKRLREECLIQQRRSLSINRSVEYHTVVLLIIRIHFGTRHDRGTHLALQNSMFRHSSGYSMNTIAGRLCHLYQPQFILHLKQLTDDTATLLTVAAVDVVEEERAHRLDTFQQSTLRHLTVVVHLHQRMFEPILTSSAIVIPVPDILLGVADRHHLFEALNGAAMFLAAHFIYQVNHTRTTAVSK